VHAADFPILSPLAAKYLEAFAEYKSPGGSYYRPLVYIMAPMETGACVDNGYQYSMEIWFYGFLRQNSMFTTQDPLIADFVYFPHCAMSTYFSTAAQYMMQGYDGGRAHTSAIRYVDEEYLSKIVAKQILSDPAYWVCAMREYVTEHRCRLLVAMMERGRHDHPAFNSMFPDAVTITTNALSDAPFRRQLYRVPHEKPPTCTCPEHCDGTRGIAVQDIVVPYPVNYVWTQRSRVWEPEYRDIFVFFAGGNSCCTRVELQRLYGRGWDVNISEVSATGHPEHLILPAVVPQKKWSEFCYRSVFCLVPDGDTAATARLADVLLHGCIPVIISNRVELPFVEWFDWSEVAVFLSEEQMPNMMQIVSSIPSTEIASRQAAVASIATFLDYYSEGFALVMHLSLSARRDGDGLGGEAIGHPASLCNAVFAGQRLQAEGFDGNSTDCFSLARAAAARVVKRDVTPEWHRPYDLSATSVFGSVQGLTHKSSAPFNG